MEIVQPGGGVSGGGTVTSVSVVTANGVSGSVANPTTTPAITLTLGAITPTSVNGTTSTEIGYVSGVTSSIQTQLNTKGTFTLPALTSGSVLFSNGSTIVQDNSTFFWDTTNKRLGLGNTSPGYRLDVTGFINTDAASGYKQAGNTILFASSVSNSVVVGVGAGDNALTSVNPAFTMTAIGTQALNGSTGVQNTAIGYQAGLNASGSQSTYIGYQAGGHNASTASGNVFIGTQAGYNVTQSTQNVAIGYAAMFGDPTDSSSNGNNVAVGYLAFSKRTTAFFNTAIGTQALEKVTSGLSNVAIGYLAVNSNQTSNRNIGIGVNAITATTGGSNIGIGTLAGSAMTSGAGNIIIGTAIEFPSNTASNQLNIGGAIFGTGITSTGTGTAGLIGICTPAPTAKFHLPAGTASANTSPLKFTSGTSLTAPEAGALEYDGGKLWATNGSTTRESLVGAIFTQTADKTVTNTVTETSIIGTGVGYGLTLPANFFIAGKTIRLRIGGIYTTPALATPSVTIKVKYGSTVLATVTTSALLSGATNLEFDGEVDITCRTVGATGTVMTHGDIEYATGVAGTIGVDPLNNAGATTTINTTTSNLLDVTLTWDSATATRSATSTVTTVEVLN